MLVIVGDISCDTPAAVLYSFAGALLNEAPRQWQKQIPRLRKKKMPAGSGTGTFLPSDGESSQAHRDTSHSRASLKPFMAGDGSTSRYVPPHERPLPKGERYDPSQAGGSNYLQQLQQMQQSSKDASAKDSSKDSSGPRPSIMKFKRAVDLIRKSKPDVRASHRGLEMPVSGGMVIITQDSRDALR
eukprot:s1305_g25.t1